MKEATQQCSVKEILGHAPLHHELRHEHDHCHKYDSRQSNLPQGERKSRGNITFGAFSVLFGEIARQSSRGIGKPDIEVLGRADRWFVESPGTGVEARVVRHGVHQEVLPSPPSW